MSSKTAAATPAPATTNGSSELKYEARLCHVVKRADFDGYGFNLHAEKGRPGQYIGKVDDGSPAESAGLRQGDRIIEVNGTNITSETHKKVVELIKAVPNETKLLVIDPRAEGADLKAAIAKSGTVKSPGVDVNDNSKQQPPVEKEKVVSNGKDSLNDSNKKQHDVNGTSEDANNKKNAAANNNVDTSANKMVNGNGAAAGDVKPKTKPVVDQIIEDTKALSMANGNGAKAAEANGKQNGSAPVKEAPKLNLNMTAAELRAQLAARKKYDPKNDVCDLRKKYEIIQKM